jgi:hypothetical protein
MIVHVEGEWSGGRAIRWRLRFEYHGRAATESVRGDVERGFDRPWTRRTASQALDLLERVYGLRRRAIRFRVK